MAHSHFQDKDALSHVAERQAHGFISSREIHGLEVSGFIHALTDSARDTCVFLSLFFALFLFLPLDHKDLIKSLCLLSFGWITWKTGRSSYLGWSRLERLHRILAQEKWEIEHNRPQEREELIELYQAKGFDGKLLDDVVDVLMADDSRLLKVMIEEEMGISLENVEHPLKQGSGAFIGSFFSAALTISMFVLFGVKSALISLFILFAASSALAAYKADNKIINALVWTCGIGLVAFLSTYFLTDFLYG